jgi:hypothetical protein
MVEWNYSLNTAVSVAKSLCLTKNSDKEGTANTSAVSAHRSLRVSNPRFEQHARCWWQLCSKPWIWSNPPIGRFIHNSDKMDLLSGECIQLIGWSWQHDPISCNRICHMVTVTFGEDDCLCFRKHIPLRMRVTILTRCRQRVADIASPQFASLKYGNITFQYNFD